jgi:hypothetical protein
MPSQRRKTMKPSPSHPWLHDDPYWRKFNYRKRKLKKLKVKYAKSTEQLLAEIRGEAPPKK